ncbi:MAG: ATP-binding protein [Gammaproteobacteria bacterium]|nr:ATP-binding protein [Gammaproteobacteria bacterium]MCP5201588.1 ATP-binding protein [Gammaproteobacteria bacterium]
MSKADKFFRRAERLLDRLEQWLPPAAAASFDAHDALAWRWRRGRGPGRLEPIRRFNGVRLDDLLHIDHQKSELVRNTRQFLGGLPANNALLWGPRGTGKSSLVKALLNDFAPHGLRLVEVDRLDLVDLPEIIDHLDGDDGRYVIYCDDLSFDDNDATYRALKTVLDGSVLDTPDNIVIYATSNRRHLLPERLSDNRDTRVVDGELHHGEAVEEKISLSERFGLWLSFHPLNQDRYLDITRHWLTAHGVDCDETACAAALQWALLHGSRSGRTASQFARDWAGRRALENDHG